MRFCAALVVLTLSSIKAENMERCVLAQDVSLQCASGEVLLVKRATIGYTDGSECPRSPTMCKVHTPVAAEQCNGYQTCTLWRSLTQIDIADCGTGNFINLVYVCIKVSGTINICGGAGEGPQKYVVSDNYPNPLPTQPHKCQCKIQLHPHAAKQVIRVTIVLLDAFLPGDTCDKKIYLTYPEKDDTICSSSQRQMTRTVFHKEGIVSNETIHLTFEKMQSWSKTGVFVLSVNASSVVKIDCHKIMPGSDTTTTATPRVVAPTSPSTTSSRTGIMTQHILVSTFSPRPTVFPSPRWTTPPKFTDETNHTTKAPKFSNEATQKNDGGFAVAELVVGLVIGIAITITVAIVVVIALRRRSERKRLADSIPNTDPASEPSTGFDNPCSMTQDPFDFGHFLSNDDIILARNGSVAGKMSLRSLEPPLHYEGANDTAKVSYVPLHTYKNANRQPPKYENIPSFRENAQPVCGLNGTHYDTIDEALGNRTSTRPSSSA